MPGDALFDEGVLDVLQLEMTHDGFNFFHVPDSNVCIRVVVVIAIRALETSGRNVRVPAATHAFTRTDAIGQLDQLSAAMTKPW